MMNAPFENIRVSNTSLRSHYEDVATDTIRSIVRWKYLIAACVLGAMVLAALLISILPRTYTAQALLYPDMSSPGGKNSSLSASVSATALVSSEAKRIGSQEIAIGVVKRLGLDTDPAFMPAPSGSDTLRKLRSIVMPESVHLTNIARAVAQLQRRLQVNSDSRTYVIAVSYTSKSPEFSATIVNAVVSEYLRSKEKDRRIRDAKAAEDNLIRLSATYGKRHPSVVKATASLAIAKRELQLPIDDFYLSQSDWTVLAEPNLMPSGPAGKLILGIAAVLGLLAGVCTAMLLDRRDNGFSTPNEVAALTSTRCVGLVPRISRRDTIASAVQHSSVRDALRAIAIAAGLDSTECLNKVVMVTTIDPSGSAYFAEALGRDLAKAGQRVLIIDAAPTAGPADCKDAAGGKLFAFNDVLGDEKRAQAFFEASENDEITILKGVWESKTASDHFALRSRPLSRFITAARERYDVLLIASPMMFSAVDTALIGRESDVRLFAALWNKTPRRDVNSAIKRLREYGVEVNGVVLTDVKHSWRIPHYQRLALA